MKSETICSILMYLAKQLLPNDQKMWVSRVSEFLEPMLCFNLPQNSHLVWTILAIFHIVLRITHGHGEPTTMSLSRKTTPIQTKFNTYIVLTIILTNISLCNHVVIHCYSFSLRISFTLDEFMFIHPSYHEHPPDLFGRRVQIVASSITLGMNI